MKYTKPLTNSDEKTLDKLYRRLELDSKHFGGYPCNIEFDYSELFRFMKFNLNNIGDPFEYSNYQVNTHAIEREVLAFFAKILHLPKPYKGYVTTGGTEGNLYGLRQGFRKHPKGIVYFSKRTHYSIEKIMQMIQAPYRHIKVQENGEFDYVELKKELTKHRELPAIFNLNIGTTMTGAIDNIEKIKSILQELEIHEYYFHCDAALSGMILPFVDTPQPFDFRAGIHSISISGHKFIGGPFPCGVVLSNQNMRDLSPNISYVKITDSTILGSRSGMAPLFLWYAIKRYGQAGFRQMVKTCLVNTAYAVKQFNACNIKAWANKNANTVVFPTPDEALIKKWQLAPYKDITHLMVMPHTRKEFIDHLVFDMTNFVKR